MQVLDVFCALLSVLALCVFLTLKCRVPAGYAPLTALCAGGLWVALFGTVGLLRFGGLLWYVLCAAALVFSLLFRRGQNNYRQLLRPAFLFFALAALCALVYLAVRQPLLSEWDEFTFWGPAVKQMKLTGGMYTTAKAGWFWVSSQTPALPSLSYLFQFFGPFAEWKIYAAYDVLLLGAVAALFGWVGFKQYKLAVPLAFIGLLTPWFFTLYNRQLRLNTIAWLSAYGDLPAGVLFGAALVCYFGLRRLRGPIWPVGVALAFLSLIKENTFVLALVAAGLIAVDHVFFGERPTIEVLPLPVRIKRRLQKRKGPRRWPQPGRYPLTGRLLRAAVLFLCAAGPYLLWNGYIGTIVRQREAVGQVGTTNISPFTALLSGVQMLVGAQPPTEQFSLVLREMLGRFAGMEVKVSAIGSGLVITLLILALFVCAIVFAKSRLLRVRAAVAMVLSTLGFAGYYLMLIFSYGIVMRFEEGVGLASYNRYVYTYYIGWFMLAVCFVALAARDGKPFGFAQGVALGLAGIMLLRVGMLLPLETSAIGYPTYYYEDQRAELALSESAAAAAGPGARLFFVSQGDVDGRRWFHYHMRLMPAVLDYSGGSEEGPQAGGGGTFGLPGEGEGIPAYHEYTPRQLQQYLEESGCTHVFLEELDERFVDAYAGLFEDELESALAGETVLYRIEGSGPALRCVPVRMEVPA